MRVLPRVRPKVPTRGFRVFAGVRASVVKGAEYKPWISKPLNPKP